MNGAAGAAYGVVIDTFGRIIKANDSGIQILLTTDDAEALYLKLQELFG
jgi:hypothetical protein